MHTAYILHETVAVQISEFRLGRWDSNIQYNFATIELSTINGKAQFILDRQDVHCVGIVQNMRSCIRIQELQ